MRLLGLQSLIDDNSGEPRYTSQGPSARIYSEFFARPWTSKIEDYKQRVIDLARAADELRAEGFRGVDMGSLETLVAVLEGLPRPMAYGGLNLMKDGLLKLEWQVVVPRRPSHWIVALRLRADHMVDFHIADKDDTTNGKTGTVGCGQVKRLLDPQGLTPFMFEATPWNGEPFWQNVGPFQF